MVMSGGSASTMTSSSSPGLGRNGVLSVVGRRHVVGRGDWIVLARLVDLHRLAVEVGVGEVVGRAAEVDQGEVELLGVLVDAGAAADDLLELGHRADRAVQHDQAAGLGVHAGGEQARGGDEDGIFRLGVDEVAESGPALRVAAGDAHDVAVVLARTRSVFSLTSAWRMRAACSSSTQKTMVFWKRSPLSFRNSVTFLATQLGAVVDDQGAVEVLLVVDAILDLVAVAVGLALSPDGSLRRRRRCGP